MTILTKIQEFFTRQRVTLYFKSGTVIVFKAKELSWRQHPTGPLENLTWSGANARDCPRFINIVEIEAMKSEAVFRWF